MSLNDAIIESYILEAQEAFDHKKYNKAAALYKKLGTIWMESDYIKNAKYYLDKAVEIAANDAEAWILLAEYYKEVEEWANALASLYQIIKIEGESSHVYYKIFQVYIIQKDNYSALKTIKKLLQIAPDQAIYIEKYAKLLKEMDKEEEAYRLYDTLIESYSGNLSDDILEEWFELATKHGDLKEIELQLKRYLSSNLSNITLKWLYARACESNKKSTKALQILLDMHSSYPTDKRINKSLGSIYLQQGDKTKSLEYYNKALDIDPLYIEALAAKSSFTVYSYGSEDLKQLLFAEANISHMSTNEKVKLHYTLGKAYDTLGDIESAFAHYKIGGLLHSAGKQYHDFVRLTNITDKIKKSIDRSSFETTDTQLCHSNKPVFIVGMPRSGTTLLEEVMSQIEGVYGAGELPYSQDILNNLKIGAVDLKFSTHSQKLYDNYLQRGERYIKLIEEIAPSGSKRIIDKMPDNFQWVGLLKLLLPNAHIIHTRRHPIEICLSAYRLHFARGHYWSDDLQMMGKRYRLYAELMDHWKRVLPEGSILDVRYEDMVNNLEVQSKRVAEFIDMPWSSSCLEFFNSKRVIKTASLTQVKQPIYTTSINRWKKYEKHLKPLLDEIGDLAEKYDAELNQTDTIESI